MNDDKSAPTATPNDPPTPPSGDGYSGQEYDAGDHAAERWMRDLERPDRHGQGEPEGVDRRDMGPDTGRRASLDAAAGKVEGSGAGAGGGNAGEDYDSDAGGDANPNPPPQDRR